MNQQKLRYLRGQQKGVRRKRMMAERLYPQRRRRRRETKRIRKFGGENESQEISANMRSTSSRRVKMVGGHENYTSASSTTAQFSRNFAYNLHPSSGFIISRVGKSLVGAGNPDLTGDGSNQGHRMRKLIKMTQKQKKKFYG